MPSDKCIPKLNNLKKKFLHFTFYVRLLFGVRYLPTTQVASDNFTIRRWALGSCCLTKSLWER